MIVLIKKMKKLNKTKKQQTFYKKKPKWETKKTKLKLIK